MLFFKRIVVYFLEQPWRIMVGSFIILLLFIGGCALTAPVSKIPKSIVIIQTGMSISESASLLKTRGIIRSAYAYKLYARLVYGSSSVKAGTYYFEKPQTMFRIAYRTSHSQYGIESITIRVIEGQSSREIAKLFDKRFTAISTSSLYLSLREHEGYLFPDTYYFYPFATESNIIETMTDNFRSSLQVYAPLIASSTRSLKDIVIMASIVEREATSTKDRQMIAGVLWKRIDKKYPLQVDPPFYYTLGKDSSQITLKDLAADSPYNLYKHTGLPPTPISNPGADALYATLNPITTQYMFYLSDEKGLMHYGRTYDEHLVNKEKYIK